MMQSAMAASTSLFGSNEDKIKYLETNFAQFKAELATAKGRDTFIIFMEDADAELVMALIKVLANDGADISAENKVFLIAYVLNPGVSLFNNADREAIGRSFFDYITLASQIASITEDIDDRDDMIRFMKSHLYQSRKEQFQQSIREAIQTYLCFADIKQRDAAGNTVLHIFAGMHPKLFADIFGNNNFGEGRNTLDLLAAMTANAEGKTPFDIAYEADHAAILSEFLKIKILTIEQLNVLIMAIKTEKLKRQRFIDLLPLIVQNISVAHVPVATIYELIDIVVDTDQDSAEESEGEVAYEKVVNKAGIVACLFEHLIHRLDWDYNNSGLLSDSATNDAEFDIVASAIEEVLQRIFAANNLKAQERLFRYIQRDTQILTDLCANFFNSVPATADKKLIATNIFARATTKPKHVAGGHRMSFALLHFLALAHYESGMLWPDENINRYLHSMFTNSNLTTASDSELEDCRRFLKYLRTSKTKFSFEGSLLEIMEKCLAVYREMPEIMAKTGFCSPETMRSGSTLVQYERRQREQRAVASHWVFDAIGTAASAVGTAASAASTFAGTLTLR